MKQAIIKNNIILLLGAFTAFFLVVFIAISNFQKNNQTQLMTFLVEEIELAYEAFDDTPQAFVATFQNENDRRITILDAQAFVIADTHDEVVGTDKSGRPEIKNPGTVYTRRSATIDEDLLYIAQIMDDGNYLRVSVPINPQVKTYSRLIWILSLTSIFWVVLYYLGLIQVNKNLLTPWIQVKKGLIELNKGNYQMMSLFSPYPEINEIIHEMNEINLETMKHLSAIESYQIQLDKILDEIKLGVMLFNHQEELIYFNKDIRAYFGLSEDAIGKPSYYQIRDYQIKDAISKAVEQHEPMVFDLKNDDKIYEVKVFHIASRSDQKSNASVLVLCKDVSTERAIEQMKRDFFSHASHELKSPLTAIRGHAELIEHQMVKGDDVYQSAKSIVRQTETMTALVEDMLMLSRLENLKEKLYAQTSLSKLLNAVMEQLSPLIAKKKMTIIRHVSDVEMFCDPIDMQKLFKNLIENAIKYSEEEKTVEITLSKSDIDVLFKVKDQGIGISKANQQRVFERFYRVDKGRLDGGTGLGLAIVKHIVLKYEGEIDLVSALSKGTTITVTLPFKPSR